MILQIELFAIEEKVGIEELHFKGDQNLIGGLNNHLNTVALTDVF